MSEDMEQKLATWEREWRREIGLTNPTREFQPYFVAYAKSRGVTPQQALTSFRGHEFVIWIHSRWSEWDAITHAGKSPAYRSDTEHAAFGAWLAAGCPKEVQG